MRAALDLGKNFNQNEMTQHEKTMNSMATQLDELGTLVEKNKKVKDLPRFNNVHVNLTEHFNQFGLHFSRQYLIQRQVNNITQNLPTWSAVTYCYYGGASEP